jgi:peptide/nickel transport system permease protein
VLTFLIRRTLWAGVLFIAVTFVTYVIFFIIPANPAALACGKNCDGEDIARVEKFLGLDQPLHIQYYEFMKRLVVDRSLGTSFANRQDVNDIILAAAPVTASLVFGGMILMLLIAFPVGIFSALRPRSMTDRFATIFTLVGVSLPSFWFGLILAYFIGYKLGWTPISGYCDAINPPDQFTQCGGLHSWAYHMLLPWITLALIGAASYVRFIRADMLETLGQDYVRTARAKGAPERIVIRRHVLRNAMLAVVTMIGMDVGNLLGGAIFIEQVFGLPGLGDTALEGVTAFDLPRTQGVVVFGTLAIIVCMWIVDMLYAWIDPRIRVT